MEAKSMNSNDDFFDFDLALALEFQHEYNPVGVTENAVFPKHKNKENYEPRTLIDQTLEIVDPTPNIYTLFMQFNKRFFNDKLLSVEVKWSNRMTSCAGVCSFRPRTRDCIISLSAPLLKLRPRKDLVETLLHEMIHGYLFLTNNNRDRDGHGPEFCKHMNRINKEAGTHITIYHSFHEEVKLYQQHWWRCNGPCQSRHPFFGTVRRAINRAPGPSDYWWRSHQENCGGQFIKVKEPEKSKEKKSKGQKTGNAWKWPAKSVVGKNGKCFDDFFTKPTVSSKTGSSDMVATKSNGSYRPSPSSVVGGGGGSNYNSWQNVNSGTSKAAPAGPVKLGTATNNVHGWGTGGPGSSPRRGKSPNISRSNPIGGNTNKPNRAVNFSGTVGGAGTGRSRLLDKFSSSAASSSSSSSSSSKRPSQTVTVATVILDSPATKRQKTATLTRNESETLVANNPGIQEIYSCPICNETMPESRLDAHLDACLTSSGDKNKSSSSTRLESSRDEKWPSIEIISSSPEESPECSRGVGGTSRKLRTNSDGFFKSPKRTATKHVPCPACNRSFEMDSLNEHLDSCLTESPRDKNRAKKDSEKRNGPNAGPSGKIKSKDDVVDLTDERPVYNESYVCLVCNVRISGDIALNDHLDECVQAIFNDDDSIDDQYNNSLKSSSSSPETPKQDDRFPCPICMQIVPEKSMNEHLDTCLSSENWE